ncbi:helix-turn-helix domain-containing protein [Nocardioides sp. Leaf374]|uniref:helix-turn-helix domain-containing protein n=1 Tax=Nocardioides sp. Leaf374 TaxID=2876560 RepID=UPI001E35D8DA|nr:helix-turn-helix domain-containing protein [Nocardioides sp. Leaf374]
MPDKDEATEALLKALGEEIRSWRLRRKMTRGDLAGQVGISETTMGRIEREGPADVGDTWRIARELGISFPDLVRRAEEAAALSVETPSLGAVASTERLEEPGEFNE